MLVFSMMLLPTSFNPRLTIAPRRFHILDSQHNHINQSNSHLVSLVNLVLNSIRNSEIKYNNTEIIKRNKNEIIFMPVFGIFRFDDSSSRLHTCLQITGCLRIPTLI